MGLFLCWAAIAVAVARFLNSTSDLTQCKVANAMRRRRNEEGECCAHPRSLPCDKVEMLEEVLTETGNLNRPIPVAQLDFDLIQEQLAGDLPVVLGKDNHAIVVFRASRNETTGFVSLEAFDPGKSRLARTLVLTGNEAEIERVCLTKK